MWSYSDEAYSPNSCAIQCSGMTRTSACKSYEPVNPIGWDMTLTYQFDAWKL